MKALTLAAVMATSMGFTMNATAGMDPYLENALIQVCKSAQADDLGDMRRTIKGYHLKEKTVAAKVVCNGENIVNFAENAGAYNTASHLQERLGGSEITDLANVYAVNF
ncbi:MULTISPECIES: DUF3718 domain-containing protein [unclassified Thalassotalea]|uniref:DUF3718 domain-containing protein n=1 Tax=unclassified Thalassotalea TaxID=2614972 RepID=UPI00145F4816|nr:MULTISPECIES: DUF3718 domain-containing protein [unclassified Thalassotalea]NMP15239.1 DUF3718 domain-containing protein [Thalassotalea sp. Y01]